MIGIVDYGSGNVSAIANIYKRLNIEFQIAESEAKLREADKLILPGVGAFDWAMRRLNDSAMRDLLDNLVLQEKKPVLGICVGMQMMARGSDEGALNGLGWIPGRVKKFDVSKFADATHLPHMGWNDVQPRVGAGLFRDLGVGARFYFLHSYFFEADRKQDVQAVTDYHGVFASSVTSGSAFGVQFHPEKSHHWGITLLRNFAEF
jgi:imidazole glycerol-phosphate synthase subunit HisH